MAGVHFFTWKVTRMPIPTMCSASTDKGFIGWENVEQNYFYGYSEFYFSCLSITWYLDNGLIWILILLWNVLYWIILVTQCMHIFTHIVWSVCMFPDQYGIGVFLYFFQQCKSADIDLYGNWIMDLQCWICLACGYNSIYNYQENSLTEQWPRDVQQWNIVQLYYFNSLYHQHPI